MTSRRTFLTSLLGLAAAPFAVKAVTPATDQPVKRDPVGYRYPRAAVLHQRLYTKLTEHIIPLNDPLRVRWIVGCIPEGGADRFRQLERFDGNRWVVEDCWRMCADGRTRLRTPLYLNRVSPSSETPPCGQGIVAIARWTEWEDHA